MRKILLFLLGVILFPACTLAAIESSGTDPENIIFFQNDSKITSDGNLVSEERIVYDFGNFS